MLATIEQVKTHMGLSGTTYDSVLTQILTGVDKFIKEDIKRYVEEETHTEQIFDGDYEWIQLDDTNLSTEGFTFEYNAGDSEDPDWQTVPRSDYELYYDEGLIFMNSLYYGKRVLRITYTVGSDTIPEDLKMLAIRLTAKIYNKRKSEGLGTESNPDYNFGWQDLLSVEDKIILDNNRLKFFV